MLKKLTTLLLIALIVPALNAQVSKSSKAKVIGAEKDFSSLSINQQLNKTFFKVKSPEVGDTIVTTVYDGFTNNIVRNQIAVYNNEPYFVNMARPWGANAARRTIAFTRIVDGNYVTIAAFDTSANTGWPDIDISQTGDNAGTVAIAAHTPNRLGIWDGSAAFEAYPMSGVTDPSVQLLGDKIFLASSGDRTDAEFYITEDFGPTINLITKASTIVPNRVGDLSVEVGMAKSPNEQHVAYYGFVERSGDLLSSPADSLDALWMYRSSDVGATWNYSEIFKSGDPSNVTYAEAGFVPLVLSNVPEADATIDNNGVLHSVYTGYGFIMNGADTAAERFTILYWNSNANRWIAISDPATDKLPLLNNPGRHYGQSYPSIATDPTGKYLFACWTAPQTTGGVVDTNATGYYWTDAVGTWSTDGGLTWSTPALLASKKNVSEAFVHSAQHLSLDGSGNLVAHLVYIEDQDAVPFIQNSPAGPATLDPIVYKVVTHAPTSVNEDGTVINNFELSQNYPNPFNPTTNIKFSLAEKANVTLKVYDMLGREVANILNEVRESGSHTVNFNASMLSSGVYIYKLNAGNFSDVKKMTLLK